MRNLAIKGLHLRTTEKIEILILVSVYLLYPHQIFAITSLKAIRSWIAPDHTRIVLDLDSPLLFEEKETNDPCVMKIELKACKNCLLKSSQKIKSPFIKSLIISNSRQNSVIIQISLSQKTELNTFYLRKYNDRPDRVVIDIQNPDYIKIEKETNEKITVLKKSNCIIVIDPGHGGEDPGAIASDRQMYMEKDIVLNVGKRVCELLNQKPGIKAYLTREGDYFISLRKRIEIAHQYHADLFLSLHANACVKKAKQGASVYYLSPDGATDEAAALLAERENASDKIGGISLGKNKALDSILIDLAQNHTINESIDLGEKVLNDLISIKGLEKEGLKCANFAVLKSPSIPSVLIELAYLSNSEDRRLLISDRNQMKMAELICNGVDKYLTIRPPKEKPKNNHENETLISKTTAKENENSLGVSQETNHSNEYKIHVVQKGETLWRISSSYGIPLDILRHINGLDLITTLLVGQELKIPAN